MEMECCVRCGREMKTAKTINQTADPGIGVYLSAVTMGIRPRLRSHYQRGIFCSCCTISVAYGPAPEGEFNLKIHRMLREIIELDKMNSIQESGKVLLSIPKRKSISCPARGQTQRLSCRF